MSEFVNKVIQVAYHRNGVSGVGFHAVVFEHGRRLCSKCGDDADGWQNGRGEKTCGNNCGPQPVRDETQRMLGIVFDRDDNRDCHVAVLDIDKLANPEIGVAFGENSWRGDQFAGELRRAIAEHDSDGSIKVGPFAIPTQRVRP